MTVASGAFVLPRTAKTPLMDNLVRPTATAFHFDHTNPLAGSIGTFNGALRQITQNAAAATVRGDPRTYGVRAGFRN